MIDIVPNASAPQAATTGNAAILGQTAGNTSIPPAGNSSGSTANALDDPQQGSFASTLQSRLKLAAINKSSARATDLISQLAPAKALLLSDKDMGIESLAQQGVPAIDPDLLAIKDGIAKDGGPGRAKEDADCATTVAAMPLPTPDPAALNAVALTPPSTAPAISSAVQGPPAFLPSSSNKPSPPTEGKTALDNARTTVSAEPATTAILAAEPEKAALTTANQDSKNGNATFQDVLSNRVVQPNANTHLQPASNLPSIAREVQSPLASTHWSTDVGNQLSWMTSNNQSRADLVLNPPQLGRIEVSINMNGDQATASFVSTNPEVRDALQGSLPRLREVLADAGVFLGQANIGAESFNQNQNGAEKGGKSPDDSFSSSARPLLVSANSSLSIGSVSTRQGSGLIDLFA